MFFGREMVGIARFELSFLRSVLALRFFLGVSARACFPVFLIFRLALLCEVLRRIAGTMYRRSARNRSEGGQLWGEYPPSREKTARAVFGSLKLLFCFAMFIALGSLISNKSFFPFSGKLLRRGRGSPAGRYSSASCYLRHSPLF